jgi:hypothetical protein
MISDPDDILDFNVMHAPPRFVTVVRTGESNIAVVTDGADFPGLVVEWPDAPEEERAEDFWALGLLHLAEVELVKLPAEARIAAITKLAEQERHDPRTVGSNVAAVVRELTTTRRGMAKTTIKLSKDEMETYRRLLIIRATAPYVGSDDASIMDIGGGVMAA